MIWTFVTPLHVSFLSDLCVCNPVFSVEEPGLWGAAVASHRLGSHDGAGDRRTPAALHCQEATHPGCNGCQKAKTTELLRAPPILLPLPQSQQQTSLPAGEQRHHVVLTLSPLCCPDWLLTGLWMKLDIFFPGWRPFHFSTVTVKLFTGKHWSGLWAKKWRSDPEAVLKRNFLFSQWTACLGVSISKIRKSVLQQEQL